MMLKTANECSSLLRTGMILIVTLFTFTVSGALSSSWAEVQVAQDIPWSGYWWPFNECGLGTGRNYYDHPSPLEKYELYKNGYYPGNLTQWYNATYCSTTQVSWAGHCGHWSFAAIMENYEILPSSIDNIVFRVGDKKGLLTLMHTDDLAIWGNADTPDEFHLWLLGYIQDQKTAFVADLEIGEEIWQYPIYKYDMTSTVSGSTESVTVEIFYADDFVHPDYIGTQEKSAVYTYNLFLNSDGEITGGEWTGNSVSDHPERLYFPISQGTEASYADYDIVKSIAQSIDDELEAGTNPVEMVPGTFHLILLDTDVYQLSTESGNTLSLDLSLYEGGGDGYSAVLSDSRSVIIGEYDITSDSSAQIMISAEYPPYTLRIYKDDYTTPGIYTLKYDSFRSYSTTIGYVPKDGNWSGFAITNFRNQTMEDIEITSYTEEGNALQTLMGPEAIFSKEKDRFLFSSLPARHHEKSEVDAVRISAKEPIGAVNLVGTSDGVAAILQAWYKGSHLVLPETVEELQANRRMFARIINESDSESEARLNLYNSTGDNLTTVDITLAPRQSYYIRPGTSPFSSVPDSGWIDIECLTSGNSLSGFQYIKKNQSLEINPAIPVTDNPKVVPHIPLADQWETQLVLINNGSTTADFILHRVQAGSDTSQDVTLQIDAKTRMVVDLHTLFGTTAADPYYRSILSVTASQPFTGYYQYQARDYEDNMIVPLMDEGDYSSSLVLSHNTQGNGWWTGLGIVNPGSEQVTVIIKAFGKDSDLLNGLEKRIELDPGAYDKFNTARLFGTERISDITYITFETENPNHKIGGFFIYANQEEGICGGHLQVTGNE